MKYCKMLHQMQLVLNVAALVAFCGCSSEDEPVAPNAPANAAATDAPSGAPSPAPKAAQTQPPKLDKKTEARRALAAEMLQVLRKSDDITTVLAKANPAAMDAARISVLSRMEHIAPRYSPEKYLRMRDAAIKKEMLAKAESTEVDAALIGSLSSMENSVRRHALKNLCERNVATTETLMTEAHELARRIVSTPANLGSVKHPRATFRRRPGEELQYIVQLMDRFPSEEYVPVLFDVAVERRFRTFERGHIVSTYGHTLPMKDYGDIFMRVLAALYKCSGEKITELRPGPERNMPQAGPKRDAWLKELRVKWEEEIRLQK